MTTWNDLVRRFWGPCSDDEAGWLLWNATCFPLGSPKQVARQLREARQLSGGDIEKAIELADAEMTEALQRVNNG